MLQIQQMKEYQEAIDESKLIIEEHEDSYHIVIQMICDEKERVTKVINDLIVEFQEKTLASKQDYFKKLKSFQSSQEIQIIMITKYIEDMHTSYGAKFKIQKVGFS
jgi:CTP synthase (UTP-ammonia lyase)